MGPWGVELVRREGDRWRGPDSRAKKALVCWEPGEVGPQGYSQGWGKVGRLGAVVSSAMQAGLQ